MWKEKAMSDQGRAGRADDYSAQADASIIRAEAQRLRARGREHWLVASATGRLMDVLGAALARDAACVPAPVRRAALGLAHEVRASRPPTSEPRADFWPGDGTKGAGAIKTRDVPFTESIRLGRMG
jgi:hypothetical protein